MSPAEDEFELSTEAGETLARASDLNLVLDAVAGGVCEGSRRGRLAQSRALAVVV